MVDIKKLIAAINPEVFCDDSYDEKGKKLKDVVKEIVKKEGYLKAAEKAKLKDSGYLDVFYAVATTNAFKLPGIKSPVESHKLIYDASTQSLEPIYFWIVDFVNEEFGESEKLVDNFLSSPGSAHFSEMSQRATILHDKAMNIFGTVNNVIRSVLNIIYDLKEFKIRLEHYMQYREGSATDKRAALLALKQIWLDQVDFKRGNSAIKVMAQNFEFVTLIDAFMSTDSLDDVTKGPEKGGLDLNERVRRILQQRISEFFFWIDQSERELKKRYEIEKIYLKSQVNSVRLYSRWLKPYLEAAKQLEQNTSLNSSNLVNAFNTTLFKLVLMAKARYDPKEDIDKGELPRIFKRLKFRNYIPFTIVEFSFRSIPESSDQRRGYGFRGRVEVEFTSFALNEDEIKILREEIGKDDFNEVYKFIESSTNESLDKINEDLEEFLDEKKEEKEEREKNGGSDSNPFSALFSFFKSEEKKKEEEKDKGVKKDSDYEKVIRSQAILLSRLKCRKLYDEFKKSYGMPAFLPSQNY